MDALPPGFALSTLLYLHPEQREQDPTTPTVADGTVADGTKATTTTRPAAINAAMASWGRLLRLAYPQADAIRAGLRRGDMTAEYLSYYTDNGAYYYYQGEGNQARGCMYVYIWDIIYIYVCVPRT